MAVGALSTAIVSPIINQTNSNTISISKQAAKTSENIRIVLSPKSASNSYPVATKVELDYEMLDPTDSRVVESQKWEITKTDMSTNTWYNSETITLDKTYSDATITLTLFFEDGTYESTELKMGKVYDKSRTNLPLQYQVLFISIVIAITIICALSIWIVAVNIRYKDTHIPENF